MSTEDKRDYDQRAAQWREKYGSVQGELITTTHLPPEWGGLEPGDTFASKATGGRRRRFSVISADPEIGVADVNITWEDAP